ncbi:MAG TPA: NADH-quinone oxidoreductase subunit C [Bacteroidales bacterium]|nr:NADH-quinone oxidoreductase subunit C [Bacteroidales bacterium]
MISRLFSEIINNSSPLDKGEIPVLEYGEFYDQVSECLNDQAKHCIAYYGQRISGSLRFYCCIADDNSGTVRVFAHEENRSGSVLKSLTPVSPQLHIFEREIHENFGVEFECHPWLKPVRYSHERSDKSKVIDNYPFYAIESEELHEVGVGPIHAGVIEPGHFRFICNGEKVLHLEIQLGYQHRGIEKLFLVKKDPLQRCIISESIAGDTVVGHALAHSQLIESLAGIEVSETLQIERCIALEMERIAVHIGDTAALCGDVAYQFGQVVCEALRTTIINTTQLWCGNRFAKGLVRPGGSNYPMTDEVAEEILRVLGDSGRRFIEITDRIYSLPSLLERFEDIGVITRQQASSIGTVGMAARTCGILRDIRKTHPFQYFKNYQVKPLTIEAGDVYARSMQRNLEVSESVRIIRELIGIWKLKIKDIRKPVYDYKLKPDTYAVSMTEGWRGEICHIAVTDSNGEIAHYKVMDPSLHNWMALALAVRNQEISDFPICNKSFNLSYCGHDL